MFSRRPLIHLNLIDLNFIRINPWSTSWPTSNSNKRFFGSLKDFRLKHNPLFQHNTYKAMGASVSSCYSSSPLQERDFVDSLVFVPPKRSHLLRRGRPKNFDVLKGPDGYIAYKIFYPSSQAPTSSTSCPQGSAKGPTQRKPFLVFAHGNACDLYSLMAHMRRLSEGLDVPVIAFDYPGYGESQGTPTEASTYRAISAVVDYAQAELGYHPSQIFLCGHSLGTGVVTHYAYLHRAYWTTPIILISPFRSIVKVVSHGSLFGAWGSIASLATPLDRFQTETKLKDIKAPVKIYHGLEDTVISPDHSCKLLSTLPPQLRLDPVWLPGIGHNDILESIPYDTLRSVLYDYKQP